MASFNKTVHNFKTFDDISSIVEAVIGDFPHLDAAELAITELMLNAVEHGNLNISFEEKSELLKNGAIFDEIERRLGEEKYRNRTARIEVRELGDETQVTINDDGEGFSWTDYLNENRLWSKSPHGRGMMLAKQFCKKLTYVGNGNRVVAVFDSRLSLATD